MEEQPTPAPPPPAPTPPAPVPVAKPNVWLWIGVCVLMLGVGIGIGMLLKSYQKPAAYVTASPSPSPTANWKTYTDPMLNYAFSHPQSVQIEIHNNTVTVRIDPPDPRMIVGTCPRYISFSAVDSSSIVKKTRDSYGCIYNAFILEEKVFVESQFDEGSRSVIDQILSTFKFLPEECRLCPVYTDFPPNFCKGGVIVSPGEDKCGCPLPPECRK